MHKFSEITLKDYYDLLTQETSESYFKEKVLPYMANNHPHIFMPNLWKVKGFEFFYEAHILSIHYNNMYSILLNNNDKTRQYYDAFIDKLHARPLDKHSRFLSMKGINPSDDPDDVEHELSRWLIPLDYGVTDNSFCIILHSFLEAHLYEFLLIITKGSISYDELIIEEKRSKNSKIKKYIKYIENQCNTNCLTKTIDSNEKLENFRLKRNEIVHTGSSNIQITIYECFEVIKDILNRLADSPEIQNTIEQMDKTRILSFNDFREKIDIAFNMFSDTPGGKDPDSYSPTLRSYHKTLWSKPLPNGTSFDLDTETKMLLHHKSELGEFFLSSDAVGHTYKNIQSMSHIINRIPSDEIDSFYALCSTIGAYIIYPSKRVDKKMTINGARGTNGKIKDRFDLTLECIRRHYLNEESPLSDTLERYASFFKLFDNFKGYIDFFLLQDLVSEDYLSIKYLIPFNSFENSPLPKDVDEYMIYKKNMTDFVNARNQRIVNLK